MPMPNADFKVPSWEALQVEKKTGAGRAEPEAEPRGGSQTVTGLHRTRL